MKTILTIFFLEIFLIALPNKSYAQSDLPRLLPPLEVDNAIISRQVEEYRNWILTSNLTRKGLQIEVNKAWIRSNYSCKIAYYAKPAALTALAGLYDVVAIVFEGIESPVAGTRGLRHRMRFPEARRINNETLVVNQTQCILNALKYDLAKSALDAYSQTNPRNKGSSTSR